MEFTEKRSRCERPGLTGNDSWFELASAEGMKPDLGEEGVGERHCKMDADTLRNLFSKTTQSACSCNKEPRAS